MIGEGYIQLTFFNNPNVYQMGAADFVLGSAKVGERVSIVWKNCILVLFYGENQESHDLMHIFANSAVQNPGIKYGACNIVAEKEVAKAWSQLDTTVNPLSQMAMKGYPFVISYQSGMPVGEVPSKYRSSVDGLTNFAITTACSSNFHPRVAETFGVQTEANLEIVEPVGRYLGRTPEEGRPPVPGSAEATRPPPIPSHLYNPNIGLVYQGTDKARDAERYVSGEGRPAESAPPRAVPVPPAFAQPGAAAREREPGVGEEPNIPLVRPR